MAGELGLLSLVWIAVLSSLSVAIFAWQRYRNAVSVLSLVCIARLVAVGAILSLGLLAFLFLNDQFQFAYVATHSNSALPQFFKLAAVWGGHEGSMLFWVFTLSLWSALISFHPRKPSRYIQHVLWIMLAFVAAFSWFTLLASNPFSYSEVYVTEGRDLNPMLQDVGLIFHPPLLYLGYIGFSTVLAFALAALLEPKFDAHWVKECRLWAVSSWMLLTLGILVGSWWAYNELGWGGWWFWDPVENASLLPWLTGTALLHTLIASSRYQQLTLWSLSLALVTFSLSILGTFIVRSGILTSVHAFAVDPSKGIALIAILALTLLGSFVLLLRQSDAIRSEALHSVLGRSYLILVSAGLLIVATFTVFLGTFYPMLYELLGLGSISVGAPYFNTLIQPLALLALLGMGMAPLMKWHHGSYVSWRAIVLLFATASFVGAAAYRLQVTDWRFATLLVWVLGAWVMGSHLLIAAKNRTVSFMVLAHVGLAVVCIGASMNSQHSYELNRKMEPGTTTELAQWQVTYLATEWYVGPNYTAEQGVIEFSSPTGASFRLAPERRHYPVRVMNMSEPAIRSTWHGDYYVTLGAKVDSKAYAVKIQYRSYVAWIWAGAIMAILGGLLPLLRSFSLIKSRVTHGAIQQS